VGATLTDTNLERAVIDTIIATTHFEWVEGEGFSQVVRGTCIEDANKEEDLR